MPRLISRESARFPPLGHLTVPPDPPERGSSTSPGLAEKVGRLLGCWVFLPGLPRGVRDEPLPWLLQCLRRRCGTRMRWWGLPCSWRSSSSACCLRRKVRLALGKREFRLHVMCGLALSKNAVMLLMFGFCGTASIPSRCGFFPALVISPHNSCGTWSCVV